MHGTDVLYSQIHQYQVQVTDPSVATQFVFTDSNVVVPAPTAADYQAYAAMTKPRPRRQRTSRRRPTGRRPPRQTSLGSSRAACVAAHAV